MLLPWRWMPSMSIGSYEVKRVDLLSDVLAPVSPDGQGTSQVQLPALRQAKNVGAEKPPKGMVCIEDFADETRRGMQPFYAALVNGEYRKRSVRIAYLGDSFIEIDILTSSLRRLLQDAYGGAGVGYVDAAPPYASSRPTIRQRYGGWQTYCVLDKGKYKASNLSLSQRYFTPRGTAWAELTGVKQPHLDSVSVHSLFLSSKSPIKVGIKFGDDPMYALTSQGTGRTEVLTYTQQANKVRWQVPATGGALCWGFAEDAPTGIAVDNFSLRGSSGQTLDSITDARLQEWNAVRPYDLIVVQFGLNVADKKQLDYSPYVKEMRGVIEKLKRCFPTAGILVVGVGDREDKLTDGKLHTLPGVQALMRYQQNMAADCHVAFWNLYQAMGGEGSIKQMVEAKPAEAGKDYTHINAHGGERIAKMLYKTLEYGKRQYQKRAGK